MFLEEGFETYFSGANSSQSQREDGHVPKHMLIYSRITLRGNKVDDRDEEHCLSATQMIALHSRICTEQAYTQIEQVGFTIWPDENSHQMLFGSFLGMETFIPKSRLLTS